MGFLASAEVVECSATDLVGQFVGHTGPKTKGVFEKALGKVLFIDEAYRLGDGLFAKEAMDEIVGLMTHERFMNKMVIVLAGYENEMNSLLGVNPGLSSRFSEELLFQNMTSDQCLELLDKELRKHEIVIPELTDNTSLSYLEMQGIITCISALPSWGNARDVKTLGKRMTQKAFVNTASDESSDLTAEEALCVMKTMLHEQLARQGAVRTAPSWASLPKAMMNSLAPPSPSMSTSNTETSKPAPPPPQSSLPPSEPSQTSQGELTSPQASTKEQPPSSRPRSSRRDAGVSDAVWNQLQADIKAQEEAKRKDAEEERRLEEEFEEAQKQQQAEIARVAELKRAKVTEELNLQKKREIERQLKGIRRRAAERKAEVEKAAAALKKKQEEEAEKKRKELEMEQRLQYMGLCPMGYQWVRQGDGYRCTGGSHFISHSDLATRY